ncbi:MAG: hypothetical protein M0Z98_12355 [Actinomycetales bacterium]|nr:hypothetical protein [Actinomycetales bacterium]
MERTTATPAGVSRPGSHRARVRTNDGAVTVEAAFGILALTIVTGALAWCLALLPAQLAVGEAARAAARVAARGDDAAVVREEARRLVPDARVEVHLDVDHVVVDVTRTVSPPGVLARWGSVHLHAASVALVERAP